MVVIWISTIKLFKRFVSSSSNKTNNSMKKNMFTNISFFQSGKGPGSKLFPPPPLQHIGGDDLAGSLSPLQRMASITNSLVSQPNLPSQSGQQHRTHRAILPPITQQQFDRFQHLNTDDVVRRVSLFYSCSTFKKRTILHSYYLPFGER